MAAIASSRQACPSRADPPGCGAIDCQSHLFVPEILGLLEKRKEDPVVYRKGDERYVRMGDWHRRVLPKHTDVQAKIADMDEAGIAGTALSISCSIRTLRAGSRTSPTSNRYLPVRLISISRSFSIPPNP